MKHTLRTFILMAVAAPALAQASSTFNYTISDAGSGNSLVTWNATGDITTTNGAVWSQPSQMFSGFGLGNPGMFTAGYTTTGAFHQIDVPDGSTFHTVEIGFNHGLSVYQTAIYGAMDVFGMYTTYDVISDSGGRLHTLGATHIVYTAGTQSAVIPVAFTNFNAGSWTDNHNYDPYFTTPMTVTLTIAGVPEASTLALAGLGVAALGLRRRRN